jgi:hypothetical protein
LAASSARLADRSLSGEILWSEPTSYAQDTIGALKRAGIAVLVVTNSDGHAAENLRDAGICETTPGASTVVTDVIDSALVDRRRPTRRSSASLCSARMSTRDQSCMSATWSRQTSQGPAQRESFPSTSIRTVPAAPVITATSAPSQRRCSSSI